MTGEQGMIHPEPKSIVQEFFVDGKNSRVLLALTPMVVKPLLSYVVTTMTVVAPHISDLYQTRRRALTPLEISGVREIIRSEDGNLGSVGSILVPGQDFPIIEYSAAQNTGVRLAEELLSDCPSSIFSWRKMLRMNERGIDAVAGNAGIARHPNGDGYVYFCRSLEVEPGWVPYTGLIFGFRDRIRSLHDVVSKARARV